MSKIPKLYFMSCLKIPIITIIALLSATWNVSAKQWLIFYGELPSKHSPSGHAFVTFLRENPLNNMTEIVGCWGFYPRDGISAEAIFGEVQGDIRNDISRQQHSGFLVEVTANQFNICVAKKNVWAARAYALSGNNCVDFLKDLLTEIPLVRKPGTLFKIPITYINRLRELNVGLQLKSQRSLGITNTNAPGNMVTNGVKVLFKGIHTKLSPEDKIAIYKLLKFKLYEDGRQFTIDYDSKDENPFDVMIFPTDLNKDGNEELFVQYGNYYTSGRTAQQITVLIKSQEDGQYHIVMDDSGLAPDIITRVDSPYPDLIIGGAGFSFPIYRWYKDKYTLYKNISDKDVKRFKTSDIQAVSKAYQLFIQR